MRILVLGAGYAGLRCALDLADERAEGAGPQVTLLDRNPYHQVITWLHEVAAAAIEPERARVALAGLVDGRRLDLRQASVLGIAPREQRVLLEEGDPIDYDRLVIALGSQTVWPPIPGLRAHALPMRWWQEAVEIRRSILDNFARAAGSKDEEERRRLLTTVVVGGGYTGCQLAGELSHWLPDLADEYGLSLLEITLRQIEAKATLLPGWTPRFAEKAERVLRRKGVQILLESPLEQVDERHYTLKGRAPLPYGTLVWSGGVRAPAMLEESGFASGTQGRLLVDDSLRARDYPEVYVAGDCALWMDGDAPLPATASHALRQGAFVARSLGREIQDRPLAPYEPTKLGLVVSLGGNDGVGSALGIPLSGLAASVLKEGIESWYLSTIGVEA